MGDMPLLWGATMATEGSPILFADLSVYQSWRGSEGAHEPSFYLGSWGGLRSELSADLCGHHFFADREEALEHLERLATAITDARPKAFERSSKKPLFAWLEAVRNGQDARTAIHEASGPLLRLFFHPASDYDQLVMARDNTLACSVAEFAGGNLALWSTEGGCVADVGHTRRGIDEVVAGRIDVERAELRALRDDLSNRATDETRCGEVDLDTGVLVIADSVFAIADLVKDDARSRAAEIIEAASYLSGPLSLSTGAMVGVATALRVDPGRYVVSSGSDKRAVWLRLRRQ